MSCPRRPVVSVAYSRGELSHSKVRAISRVTDAGEETDTALVRTGPHWHLPLAG